MTFRAAGCALAALALGTAPAAGQIAPGTRAPESVVQAVGDAWLLGCFFAAAERPAAGLNMGFDLAGPSLHPARSAPDDLRPLITALPGHMAVAVVDAPGGQVFLFHDRKAGRCLVVPTPATTPGIEAEFLKLMARDWKAVEAPEGVPAGVRVFEDSFPAALGRPAVRLRAWYQPAQGPAQPQMIVTEQVRKKGK